MSDRNETFSLWDWIIRTSAIWFFAFLFVGLAASIMNLFLHVWQMILPGSWGIALGFGILYLLGNSGQKAEAIKVRSCPHCGRSLKTHLAKQCFECGMDWHDPNNIIKRGN